MPIKTFFDAPSPSMPAGARAWSIVLKSARDLGRTVVCKLDRQRDGLVFRPAQIFLFVKDGDRDVDSKNLAWDSSLNDWLLGERVRAENSEAEVERFGFALNDRFAPVELRFGDGFFNAVLVQRLRNEGLADVSPTREKLALVHEPTASPGPHADDCRDMVNAVIGRCAAELRELGYVQTDAEPVLVGALAYYLDERFSITNSKLLGFA